MLAYEDNIINNKYISSIKSFQDDLEIECLSINFSK